MYSLCRAHSSNNKMIVFHSTQCCGIWDFMTFTFRCATFSALSLWSSNEHTHTHTPMWWVPIRRPHLFDILVIDLFAVVFKPNHCFLHSPNHLVLCPDYPLRMHFIDCENASLWHRSPIEHFYKIEFWISSQQLTADASPNRMYSLTCCRRSKWRTNTERKDSIYIFL